MPYNRNPASVRKPVKNKRLRCLVLGSEKTKPDPGFVYTWLLKMPCGLIKRSRAQDPPVTVACNGGEGDCKDARDIHKRDKLPVFDF